MGIDFNLIRSTRIALTGLQNTRDLGGYPAFGGRRVRRGRLIRSGMLMRAREDDLNRLCGLHGLRTVVDFRTPMEAKQQPDPAMEGVRYIDNPLLDEASLGVTRERIGDEAAAAGLAALNSVQPRYLEAVFASIDEKFGSLEDYLQGAMGLDDAKRSRLRELYLE